MSHDERRRDRRFSGTCRLVDPDTIRQRFDWPRAATRRLDWVEEAMMAAAFREAWIDPEKFMSYSRAWGWWSSPGRHYLDRRFSYRTVIPAVDRLEYLGLLDHDKKHSSPNGQWQSRFRASADIRVLAEIEPPPPIRHDRMRDTVLLRDENKISIGFRESRFTQRQRRIIAQMQEAHDGIVVNVDDTVPCLRRQGDYLRVADKRGAPYGIHLQTRPYFTVFSESSWSRGGRRYGPWVQRAPQAIRAHVTINGEPTSEADYGQTHFRMVCAEAGLDVDADDLFNIPGFERKDVKRMAYVMLNADSLREAQRAFAHKRPKGAYALAGMIAAALKERFPKLEPYLHSGIGLALQRKDADVADDVLLSLLRKGVTALPVFDSFLVPAPQIELLEEAMVDAWKRQIGTKITVHVK
jgi:hypothetical protein